MDINFNKICKDLTSCQKSELFQMVMSYIDSIDKVYSASIDVVCPTCKSGKTNMLLYSVEKKTRCNHCKSFLSHRPPVFSELHVYDGKVPYDFINSHILPPTTTPTTTTTTTDNNEFTTHVNNAQQASSSEFARVAIPETPVYNPNVVVLQVPDEAAGAGCVPTTFGTLKPKGL